MSGPWETARRLGRVVWRVSAFLVVWSLLYSPFVLWLTRGLEKGELPRSTWLGIELCGTGSILVAAAFATRVVDRRSLRSLGFDQRGLPGEFLAGLALGLGMMAIAVLPAWAAGWLRPVAPSGFSWTVLAVLTLGTSLNSITQEVLVRGYLLQTIEAGFGVVAAVVVSSVIFAGLHAGAISEGGVVPAINLLAAGVLLGLAYTATRNLWLPIGLHFSWNVLQGPVLGMAVSGEALDGGWRLVRLEGPDLMIGGDFGLEGGLAGTAATLLGIGGVLTFSRVRTSGRIPHRDPGSSE